jgi:hypothetical protein
VTTSEIEMTEESGIPRIDLHRIVPERRSQGIHPNTPTSSAPASQLVTAVTAGGRPGTRRPRERNGRRRIPILIAVCLCVGGCVSRSISFDSLKPLQPNDASRNSITDLSSAIAGGMSLPHRDLIRVDFTSGTDLRNMVAREANVLLVHSYFCDQGDNLGSLGDPGVYVDRADAGKETLVKRFLFFIDVSRKSNLGSIPPEQGFDLSVHAQDICFYITAHSVITTYTSKVETIPKASIEQVFIGWKLH